jgi:hypothetical protein
MAESSAGVHFAAGIDFEEVLMSTSAVSNSSIYQQLQSYFQNRNSDVQQLGQALSSGNLSDAQTAFNNITTLAGGGPFAQGNAFYSQTRDQDFAAIGQALQSGNLADAQQAFAALKATGRNGAPYPTSTTGSGASTGPVTASGTGPEIVVNLSGSGDTTASSTAPSGTTSTGAASSSGAGPEIVVNLANTGSATSLEQITINIGNSTSGGGEQVSLSVGNQGSNPEQITFNLGANSNEQIVLNLLSSPASSGTSTASTTSTTTGNTTGSGISVSA